MYAAEIHAPNAKGIVSIIVDPLKKYKKTDPTHLLELLGVLPRYFAETSFGTGIQEDTTSLIKIIEDGYIKSAGTNPIEIKGGKVNPKGEYVYPCDPKLYPIAMIPYRPTDEIVYFYPYAITAVVNGDSSQWITRLD